MYRNVNFYFVKLQIFKHIYLNSQSSIWLVRIIKLILLTSSYVKNQK